MSLITEALRKARQEAVRQEALKSGSAYPFMVEPTPDRGRTRTYLILGALAVLLAAGLGAAGAVWLMSDRMGGQTAPAEVVAGNVPERAPAAAPVIQELPAAPDAAAAETQQAEPVVPEPSPAQPQPEAVPEATAPERLPRPVIPPPSREPAAEPAAPQLTERPIQLREPAPSAAEVEAPVSDPVLPVTGTPPAPPATPQPSGPTEAARAVGLENGKTFLREVPVPGGGTLRLNGIAFSENPVALFTDRVVGLGEGIQGFTVSKVEAGRVELQGHGVTVYVTVK